MNDYSLETSKRISNMERRAAHNKNILSQDSQVYRLPPGQSLVKSGFPVLDLGIRPAIKKDSWRLTVDGEVGNPITLNQADLSLFPEFKMETDIHCVTAWSVFDASFKGVSTKSLKGVFGLSSKATHVLIHGYDGYSTNLSVEDFFSEGVMFATHLNGEALPDYHGGPVRLVVPHLYYWKSPKWVSRLEFLSADSPGFWEQKGYHNRGNPWNQERYGPKQHPTRLDEREQSLSIDS